MSGYVLLLLTGFITFTIYNTCKHNIKHTNNTTQNKTNTKQTHVLVCSVFDVDARRTFLIFLCWLDQVTRYSFITF
jgi:hypothetical protein